MADIDLKTETPDTTLPTDGFLFGADSQSAASPSVYPVANAITTFVGNLQSSDLLAWNSDTILRRRAAANLQLGAADAAAPVAQTLSVQSVVAGTTNTAGANLTIAGSQGTGTGAGGSIVFRVAPAGASGTAQNALVAGATLAPSGTGAALTIAGGTVTANAPVLDLTQTWNDAAVNFEGLRFNATDTASAAGSRLISLKTNGVDTFIVEKLKSSGRTIMAIDGFTISKFRNQNRAALNVSTSEIILESTVAYVNSSMSYGWYSVNSVFAGGAVDLTLSRDAADTLAQRRSTNAQESRVYGSYTSATNFQRLSIKTLRESSGALSGASYTTTIAIPAYAHLIGVTTRVTTEVTGATDYDVGDGSDVDLWGAAVGVTLGSESRTADFTNIAAVGPAATSRTVTLTANGSNFTAGVIEICLHYLTTEAD
jgi:hypothetical protein